MGQRVNLECSWRQTGLSPPLALQWALLRQLESPSLRSQDLEAAEGSESPVRGDLLGATMGSSQTME